MIRTRFLLGTVMVAFVLALVACASAAPVREVTDASIDPSHELEDVRTAIMRAGAGRGWRMNPQDEGHILATLEVRDHMAQVDIYYDESSYDIVYRDSVNLDYNPDEGTIHPNYNGWIENLELDIHNNLAAM